MVSEMSVLHTGQRAHPVAVEVMFCTTQTASTWNYR